MKKCCFCGHRRKWDINPDIVSELGTYIEELIIKKDVSIFYSGGMGEFDKMCEKIVRELKCKYPNVRLHLIIPYMKQTLNKNFEYYNECYDEIYLPDLENIFYKAAILERNRWMVRECNFMVAYVSNNDGGAKKTLDYALKHDIVIKNFADDYAELWGVSEKYFK